MDIIPPADPQPTRAGIPTPQRPGWWSRNWKWFVPTGCFTLLLIGAAFVGAFVLLLFGTMKSNDVYRMALTTAKGNGEVQFALGNPIKDGWFVSGNIHTSNGSGDADLSFPISGPKGKGKVYAIATRKADRWTYSTLEVAVPRRKDRIDLLTP